MIESKALRALEQARREYGAFGTLSGETLVQMDEVIAALTQSGAGDDASREAAKRMSVRGPSPIYCDQCGNLLPGHASGAADVCGCGLTQPGAASRVTFTVRCNYCGHLPCDCTEQPGAAGQE